MAAAYPAFSAPPAAGSQASSLAGDRTGGRLSLVEHPLEPRALGSPLHTHRDEDEYSVVLEGQVGAQIGGQTVVAGPAALPPWPARTVSPDV